MSFPAPRFLFVPVYDSCNLRCPHCEFWRRPHTLNQTSWADVDHRKRQQPIMREFATMNPEGTVVTHGGESLLNWEAYLTLTRYARNLGLRLLTVTNGSMIFSPEKAAEIVIDGPAEINVSLDSIHPEIHDKFRGATGAFDKAVRALRLLLEARARWGSNIKVNAILLVGKSTYLELDEAYNFTLNKIGVDKLKLNMVQPSFGNNSGEDPFFAEESDVDPSLLGQVLFDVDVKHHLDFNPIWIRQITMYFRSIRANPKVRLGWNGDLNTFDHICNSYDRNIWLSDRSDMFLCCDSRWPGMVWEKPGDMRRFWEEAQELRSKMSSCNRLCGVSHSLRNTSATLKR